MKITAKGKIVNTEITIIAEQMKTGVKFLFDGKKDEMLEKLLVTELEDRPFFGNYTPDVYEDLNIYNVLENHFFDELISIKAEGLSELPYDAELVKKGGVY